MAFDSKLMAAEETLNQASSLLAGWTTVMSQMMGQGRAVDEALRQRIKSELVAVEESIHSTLMSLSSDSSEGGFIKVKPLRPEGGNRTLSTLKPFPPVRWRWS